jgi:hypothetical protein
LRAIGFELARCAFAGFAQQGATRRRIEARLCGFAWRCFRGKRGGFKGILGGRAGA